MSQNNKHGPFMRLEAARQVLRERAEDIVKEYMDIAAEARTNGNYFTALKALQWLIEHMPKDQDGQGIIERSVDADLPAVPVQQASKTPNIKIGIQLGGVTPKQLPAAETIDADPEPSVRTPVVRRANLPSVKEEVEE